ncbi:g6f-like [Halichoeres trimaculatus]|uniref:g6f-like n=1 Tax=Halichoeres trimaculatus TaxID=147232 RepID=UPI003D9E0358
MESASLTFIFVLSFAVFSSQFGVPDWDDVLVAREGMPTTLVCTDDKVRGAVAVNWLMKPARAKDFKLVLSANEKKERSGEASNESMRLTDPNFQDSGDFSLFILPKIEDSGYYSCLIKQQKLKLKERIILLAILTVSVAPSAPILQQSILRLTASVNPGFAITKITWEAPGGNTMKSESTNKGTVAKLPMVQRSDGGAYVCVVYPLGNSSSPFYHFSVDVTVADKVIPSNNITYRPVIRTATQEGTPLPLTCPDIRGDYVDVYWLPPDSTRKNMKLVHHYDRWRGNGSWNDKHDRLKPAGSPYNADTGSFSFLLTPTMKDGGLYSCSVYLNDHVTSQKTRLSVLKVTAVSSSTRLELGCRYTERSIVRSAKWKHQNESRQLRMTSKLGSISIFLPLPITSDTAGNYTCIIQLTSGQTVSAKHEVKPPFVQGNEESVSVTTPSLLPSLSALLLLVPLVAVAVSVLLWRQKHISDRGIEQSLSVSSGEVENVYENPEDIRQAPPQGSVYMDLKPRGEDDVYKELERFEQCQG